MWRGGGRSGTTLRGIAGNERPRGGRNSCRAEETAPIRPGRSEPHVDSAIGPFQLGEFQIERQMVGNPQHSENERLAALTLYNMAMLTSIRGSDEPPDHSLLQWKREAKCLTSDFKRG